MALSFSLLLGDITKKLSEIQTRLISSDEFQRKQNDFIGSISKKQDLLNNIESKLDHLSQNIENENDIKRRTDTQRKCSTAEIIEVLFRFRETIYYEFKYCNIFVTSMINMIQEFIFLVNSSYTS